MPTPLRRYDLTLRLRPGVKRSIEGGKEIFLDLKPCYFSKIENNKYDPFSYQNEKVSDIYFLRMSFVA
jgi:hypothetical protein